MPGDVLESLRCPKGCSTRFLQYLIWEGTSLRICADQKGHWVQKSEYEREFVSGTGGFDIGLRCGDCGTQFGRQGVSPWIKKAFDRLLDENQHVLSDFKDEIDDAWLREHLGSGGTT